MSWLINYRKPWRSDQSIKSSFPLGESRSFRAEILNPAGVIVSRETRNVYVPTLTGAPDQSLEFTILWKHQSERYMDQAGVQPEARFTVAEDFMQGRALSCYRRLRDNPNGPYMPAVAANRTVAQFHHLLKDMQCILFDVTYCGNKVKQEITKWRINDYKTDPNQALSDLYVEQQHRLDELTAMAEGDMHHRGANWDDAYMIDLLHTRVPDAEWEWLGETGFDPFDGQQTPLDVCEKLDHKHKQAIKKKKKEAEKKEQKNEKLDNDGENKRANADVDNRSNKRRCLHSDRDDDSDAINESSCSDEESSSGDEQSSSGDDRSSDDEILSDDDGSRVESDDDSYSSDRRDSTATTQAPAHGDSRVVLLNGMDCTWKNCLVNPDSNKFDWEAAKHYMYKEGGRNTWYADVFHEESRKRRASRQPQSHFQAPAQGPQYHPYYPPVPQAYHQQYMPSQGPSPGQALPPAPAQPSNTVLQRVIIPLWWPIAIWPSFLIDGA
ncbi:hypothetical protein THAOC_28458, partial [Thalassiosira oceanica]